MERGVKMLRRIITIALLVGLLVILFHPDYRDTAQAIWRGEVEQSAIWDSNRAYYTEVVYDLDDYHEVPK